MLPVRQHQVGKARLDCALGTLLVSVARWSALGLTIAAHSMSPRAHAAQSRARSGKERVINHGLAGRGEDLEHRANEDIALQSPASLDLSMTGM